PVNTAKQSSHRGATSVSTARHVKTAASRPHVNNALPTIYSYFKAHSPVRRPFNKKSAAKTNNFKEKVNTAKRPKGNLIDHISKDSRSYTLKRFNYVDPQGKLKHMTRNKSYLTDYQEIDGVFVAFGGNAKGGGLTCLFAKATLDESNLWHIRLSHINFKTMNKLVRGNLVRGPRNSDDEVADDAGKKSIEVPRKKNGVQDLTKEGRERAQRNEFESMFGQDKDANGNRIFTLVSVARSTYVYLGGSIPINAATLLNTDLPTDPLIFQVTPKISHLHDVKRIFRYLKGQSKLGLWYPRDSPFDLESFSNSDYAKASLDMKSTTGGCQFLRKILISWQWFIELMHKKFQMSSMRELTFFLGLQVMQKDDGIFISQDKHVADILKKFDFSSEKTASTPLETNKFQVTPKISHLHDVKRIFRYLKGQSKLGLWYPRDSPFDLESFSNSDYAEASLDMKSTTGGCQFLRKILISWQCKKQTVVANSTTKVEYVAAVNCCGQVLWIQN
nr:hypothetical protein [Tanacetum cinerariifolium]